jgi:hypothetical protein
MARRVTRDDNGNGNGGNGPIERLPVITRIEPGSGTPGTQFALTGLNFGTRAGLSGVRVHAYDEGGDAAIVSWSATRVQAVVPPVATVGAAGLCSVTLSDRVGDGDMTTFVVIDTAAPRITGLSRTSALSGDELHVYGERFGMAGTPGSSVTIGGASVPILAWSPGEVVTRVPDLATVGGPGNRPVTVGTPWGQATPASFTLLEPPTIVAIEPAVAAPDAEVRIAGRGFGDFAAGQSAVLLRFVVPETGDLVETSAELVAWAPTEIRAVVPGLTRLKASGAKDVVVRMPLASSAAGALEVADIGSITSWTRIEPHPRIEDLETGLGAGMRAEIADPLWMLGRQWTLGELTGENRGSPVVARLQGESAPLWRWRPSAAAPASDLPTGVPLETLVEAERVFPAAGARFDDLRLAVEAGLQFLRTLAVHVRPRQRADLIRRRYSEHYALDAPDDADLDVESRRFLTVVDARVPDGARLFDDLRQALPPDRGGTGELPTEPQIPGRDREGVIAAIVDWFDWCEGMVAEPAHERSAWDAEHLEYAFSVSAQTSSGEIVLNAPEYFEGHLDWTAFVRADGGSLAAGATIEPPAVVGIDQSVLPGPATYPGMPAPRWWEIEDARVNFGSVDAGPPDLIRLLFIEFASAFGNDWFTIPVDRVPAGSVSRISSLTVTDTFGRQVDVPRFAETGPGGAWRMFQLTGDEEQRDLLLLPPALVAGLEGAPIEEVALLRDELANMGWAVERIVTGATGRPLRRHEAEQEARRRADATAPPPATPDQLTYRLMTTVPEYWIPLVPRVHDGSLRLLRAAMRRVGSGGALEPIPPLGRILEPETEALRIHDAEVPRAGIVVTRSWQLARGPDGDTHLWIGRRKRAGRGEGSSGLRFDVAEPGREIGG